MDREGSPVSGRRGLATPEICEALEERDVKYAIRIPANENLQRNIEELLKHPAGRPRKKPLVENKGFLYQAKSWKMARRVIANRIVRSRQECLE